MGVLRSSSKAAIRSLRSASKATKPSTFARRGEIRPQQDATLVVRRKDGSAKEVPLLLRIDTPIEVDYYQHGGILPFVLREILGKPDLRSRSRVGRGAPVLSKIAAFTAAVLLGGGLAQAYLPSPPPGRVLRAGRQLLDGRARLLRRE